MIFSAFIERIERGCSDEREDAQFIAVVVVVAVTWADDERGEETHKSVVEDEEEEQRRGKEIKRRNLTNATRACYTKLCIKTCSLV